jgi:hypothetical protein
VLGTTLWFVVVMGLMATVLMNGAAAFGRASVQAAADHAAEAALHDALADYQNRLRPLIANGATASAAGAGGTLMSGSPLPTVTVTPAQHTAGDGAGSSGEGPGFSVGYDVTPTTITPPSCAWPEQSGADIVSWLQCHALVRESRASLRVTVRVFDSTGTEALARREQTVTLRLFALPPYSAVVGRADGTADSPTSDDALTQPAHEGDVAGDPAGEAGSGTPVAPTPSPWPQGGPLLHVRYSCSSGDCADSTPPDPDAALRAHARWTDGNVPAS